MRTAYGVVRMAREATGEEKARNPEKEKKVKTELWNLPSISHWDKARARARRINMEKMLKSDWDMS